MRSPGTAVEAGEAENARRRKPRTPGTGAGGRERLAQETENTRSDSREHPALEQEAENARRRKPRTPGLVGALRTPGAWTRVTFGCRSALFIPAISRGISPHSLTNRSRIGRERVLRRAKKQMSEKEGWTEARVYSSNYLSNGVTVTSI